MSQPKPRPSVDLEYPTEARGRTPAFASVEEEAAFWDTHDFTDFAAGSSPVQIRVGPEFSMGAKEWGNRQLPTLHPDGDTISRDSSI
jgi:hypothetical protein